MHKNFAAFAKQALKDFFEATVNLFLFLPYFFSITNLSKTLFSPWKNLVTKKTKPGFSLSRLMEQISFNLISRFIGFAMRLSIISFYFILQTLYLVALPFLFIAFIVVIPVLYLNYVSQKTPDEKKAILKNKFVSEHLLNQENVIIVNQWFEKYYEAYLHRAAWWKISNLFSMPPLARDWAMGYTPTLQEFTEELTGANYQNVRFKTIVDRQKEIREIEQALIKSAEANVLVVGEEGVGKHTIIDALAKMIYEGKTITRLSYKRVLKLDMEKIFNGKTDFKERENFLAELFQEAADAKNIILMIENFDKYVGYGSDRIDLSTVIEKFAKISSVQFLGTTTPFFYEKFIFPLEKISRLFTKIDVAEVSPKDAENILLEITPFFEKRNGVIIPYETIGNTIEKCDFYMTNIPFPEKALDLLDNACSFVKLNGVRAERAQPLPNILLPEIIDTVLTEKTHMPTKITDDMRQKLINLDFLLKEKIINQEEAMTKLSAALRRSFILLGKRKKPLAAFLFFGPTGVGKTETAKVLSEIIFGAEKYMVRFDMSLYQSKSDIPKLIGSMETNNPGLLVNAIRENPYCVLLLDEIEKADHDLINIFLTLLDEGYITDGFGKRVDCKNTIIIATSNAADINRAFAPEFLNRFDGVIVYKSLTTTTINELTKRMISQIAENLYKLYQIKINISPETMENLSRKGFDPQYGARNLERVITQELEDKVAKLILEKKAVAGQTIML